MSEVDKKFIDNAIFLVDASSYIFRAYYAIQTPLKAPDGTPTHATYGFLQMLLSLEREYKAKNVVLIWDRPEKGFRHEIFPEYKANRSSPPEDLGIQIENSKIGSTLLGYPQLELIGFEADDIIATFVKRYSSESNLVIVTADKDLLQLVGPKVWCLDTMRKKWSNLDEAKEKFGVVPEKIREIQALCGDSVDNIPGAPGVGPKTAIELINFYGTLEAVLEAAKKRRASGDTPPKGDPLKGKRIEAVADNDALIRVSLRLVSLDSNVAISEEALQHFHKRAIHKNSLKEWAVKMGFGRLVTMAEGLPDGSASALPTAEANKSHPISPAIENKKFATIVPKSLDELSKILRNHDSATAMALDTETLGLDSRKSGMLVGISFAFNEDAGYYVPLKHVAGENLDFAATLKIFDDFFKSRPADFSLIFQNAKFDLQVFKSEGLVSIRKLRIEDTMVQSFVFDPGEAHGMDALAAKHLEYQTLGFEELLKTHGAKNFAQVPIEPASFYSAEDAIVTLRLFKVLSEKLREQKLWDVYDLIDRPLVLILCTIEETGVYLDPAPLKELSVSLHKDLLDKEAYAKQTLRDSGLELSEDLNLGSPKQIAEILYEKLKLPIVKRGKTGPSTDVKVLEELSHLHPFCKALLDIRELSKLLSTYVDALPELVDPATGRLHTDFSQVIAATGRLSSSRPNLQNIPIRTERGRKIRDAFSSPAGSSLVGVDYSQVELRLLAGICGDPELLKAFREGADIHKRTAALILKKNESEITDDDRRMAKTINFGIVYGQTAYGLAQTLDISRLDAQHFIDEYFKTYPGIKKYIENSVRDAKLHNETRTLTGRRRPLPDINSKNGMLRQFADRMAINSPVQGLAADWMKAAMIKVFAVITEKFPDVKLILQVHDELLFEVPAAQKDELRKTAVEIMEDNSLLQSFGIKDFPVKLKTESAVGQHWGEL